MTMTERTKTQEEVAIAGSFCKTNRVEKHILVERTERILVLFPKRVDKGLLRKIIV